MRRSFNILCSVCVLLCLTDRARAAYSQIVVFGDSLSDTGNVNNQTFGISPGSAYYQGRFSNGPVWVEDLAGSLGVAAPTYSRGGGKDYAFGGTHTGGGNITYTFFSFPNIGTQISNYLAGNTPTASQLYVVWGGGNDFFDGQTNPTTVVNNIAAHVTALYNAGARDILVPNLPLLGEVPDYNTTASRTTLDALSSQFDAQLATKLAQLDAQPGLNLFPLDVQTTFTSILANPGAFGFTNATQPAHSGSTTVANPDQYVFWDGKHPTRIGHQLIAAAAMDAVNTHNWIAAGTAAFATAGNWDPAAAPASAWVCKLTNTTASPEAAVVTGATSVKRAEVTGGGGSIATMSVVVQPGASLTAAADVQVKTDGVLELQGGGTVAASSIAVSAGGSMIGEGAITGAVLNGGAVSPGHSVGSITVNGTYTQQPGATLSLDLGGPRSGDFDTLVVTGAAALDGTLAVRATNGFIPLPGESFRVLTFGSRSGDFATVANQTGFAGLRFLRNYDVTGLSLNPDALPGDANLDATVDLTDFTFLASNFNGTGKTWLDADFNGDGAVDLTDFTFLASHFNQSLTAGGGSPGSSVPEPSALFAIVLTLPTLRRPRHTKPH